MIVLFVACDRKNKEKLPNDTTTVLQIRENEMAGTLSVFRKGSSEVLVTQNAKPDFRPFLHPIMAPDGKGELTEYSPGHHKHQTGLYWGFTRVNGEEVSMDTVHKYFYNKNKNPIIQKSIGRDFFHNPGEDYWRKVSMEIITAEGAEVSWQTVYEMLDKDSKPILQETQIWKMTETEGKFILDLEWQGKAIKNITIGEFDYGGLFLRMPWKEGIKGEAINAARQINEKADEQRREFLGLKSMLSLRSSPSEIIFRKLLSLIL